MSNIPKGNDYKSHTYRCNICDCVSTEELSDDTHLHHRGRFRDDPSSRFGYLCDECIGEIDDTLEGYGYDDDPEDTED